jgi:hypothetical protein
MRCSARTIVFIFGIALPNSLPVFAAKNKASPPLPDYIGNLPSNGLANKRISATTRP